MGYACLTVGPADVRRCSVGSSGREASRGAGVVCAVSGIDPAVLQAVLALTGGPEERDPDGPSAPAGSTEGEARTAPHRPGRFLTVAQVAEELAVSASTVGTLIRRGRLQALKVDGRQWRIERAKLEEFIQEKYASSAEDRTQ